MPELSVILCAHNPRPEFLRQTLATLAAQTLAAERWEFLLVDNASATPLAGTVELAWQPAARHVHEPELGLTPARLRGIREACGNVLLFVDDDNLLAPDYLAQALALAGAWPKLGVWGGGITGRFETTPPAWAAPYLGLLALRAPRRDRWSNSYTDGEAQPCGAGMVVRAEIARAYAARVTNDPLRRGLGRKGASLASCEDSDLAYTAIDLGLGVGVFTALQLTHLIPAARLTDDYLLRLMESMAFSSFILHRQRGLPAPEPHLARRVFDLLRARPRTLHAARMEWRRQRGHAAAAALLRQSPPVT